MKTMKRLFQRITSDGSVRHQLREFNLSTCANGRPKSVKNLALSMGFSVSEKPLRKGLSGYLRQDSFADNGYEIVVNANESVKSRRWTVLHEMGHYFLHSEKSDPLADPLFLDRSASNFYTNVNEEMEANQFAATILFGDGSLEAAVLTCGRDISKLSGLFGVSRKTIEIALKQFLK